MAAPLLEALNLSADHAPTVTYVIGGLALLILLGIVQTVLFSVMPETHDKPAMAQS